MLLAPLVAGLASGLTSPEPGVRLRCAVGLERELRLRGSGLLRVDAVAAACDGDGVFAACHRYRQEWAVDVQVRPGAPAELVLDLRG